MNFLQKFISPSSPGSTDDRAVSKPVNASENGDTVAGGSRGMDFTCSNISLRQQKQRKPRVRTVPEQSFPATRSKGGNPSDEFSNSEPSKKQVYVTAQMTGNNWGPGWNGNFAIDGNRIAFPPTGCATRPPYYAGQYLNNGSYVVMSPWPQISAPYPHVPSRLCYGSGIPQMLPQPCVSAFPPTTTESHYGTAIESPQDSGMNGSGEFPRNGTDNPKACSYTTPLEPLDRRIMSQPPIPRPQPRTSPSGAQVSNPKRTGNPQSMCQSIDGGFAIIRRGNLRSNSVEELDASGGTELLEEHLDLRLRHEGYSVSRDTSGIYQNHALVDACGNPHVHRDPASINPPTSTGPMWLVPLPRYESGFPGSAIHGSIPTDGNPISNVYRLNASVPQYFQPRAVGSIPEPVGLKCVVSHRTLVPRDDLAYLPVRDIGEVVLKYFDTVQFLGRGGKIQLFLRGKQIRHTVSLLPLDAARQRESLKRELIATGGSPTGSLPVLVHQGNTFCETSAIMRYLAKRVGEYGCDHSKGDYLADMIMDKLAYWNDDLMAAVAENLEGTVGEQTRRYLHSRTKHFELFNCILTQLSSPSRDHEVNMDRPGKARNLPSSFLTTSSTRGPTWCDYALFGTLYDDGQLLNELRERGILEELLVGYQPPHLDWKMDALSPKHVANPARDEWVTWPEGSATKDELNPGDELLHHPHFCRLKDIVESILEAPLIQELLYEKEAGRRNWPLNPTLVEARSEYPPAATTQFRNDHRRLDSATASTERFGSSSVQNLSQARAGQTISDRNVSSRQWTSTTRSSHVGVFQRNKTSGADDVKDQSMPTDLLLPPTSIKSNSPVVDFKGPSAVVNIAALPRPAERGCGFNGGIPLTTKPSIVESAFNRRQLQNTTGGPSVEANPTAGDTCSTSENRVEGATRRNQTSGQQQLSMEHHSVSSSATQARDEQPRETDTRRMGGASLLHSGNDHVERASIAEMGSGWDCVVVSQQQPKIEPILNETTSSTTDSDGVGLGGSLQHPPEAVETVVTEE